LEVVCVSGGCLFRLITAPDENCLIGRRHRHPGLSVTAFDRLVNLDRVGDSESEGLWQATRSTPTAEPNASVFCHLRESRKEFSLSYPSGRARNATNVAERVAP
jgi:hypothetical protein